jgi:hypothetical protein
VTTALRYAALGCVAAGLLSGLLALLLGRDIRGALRVALDLWLAAGLLRLALPATTAGLLAVASIIAVRQLIGFALRRPGITPGGGGPGGAPQRIPTRCSSARRCNRAKPYPWVRAASRS